MLCFVPCPLVLRFNVPTLHFVLLVPFLAALLREGRRHSPLILARARYPPTPSKLLSPISELHIKNPLYTLASPGRPIIPPRDHSHGHGHTCLPPTVRPSQPRMFTRPVKSLSIRHRQSHISFSALLYTPHPSSRPGRHVCRAVSLPPATRSRMHTHPPFGSCRSTSRSAHLPVRSRGDSQFVWPLLRSPSTRVEGLEIAGGATDR